MSGDESTPKRAKIHDNEMIQKLQAQIDQLTPIIGRVQAIEKTVLDHSQHLESIDVYTRANSIRIKSYSPVDALTNQPDYSP
jgi:hypothetical protein